GDERGAREQLEAVARMGAGAGPDDLELFDGYRFGAVRRRLRENAAPIVKSKVEFGIEERDLLPESLAFDATDGSWYVGSLRKRKIVRWSADGVVVDWIASGRDGLGAVLGIKMDAARAELWAASCNDPGGSPAISPPDEATLGRGALYRFRLPGGELGSVHPAGDRESPVCFNDLVIAADGTVYATGTGGIWRLGPESPGVELWHPYAGLLNGIGLNRDGTALYVADHFVGIVRVETASGAETVLAHPATTSLAGVDGLYVHNDYLVAVQNGFRSGPERVLQAFLASDGASVTCVNLLERNHPKYSVPTTGVPLDGALVYVATSQLDRLDAAGEPAPPQDLISNVFLRVPLLATCTPERRRRSDIDYDPCADALVGSGGGIDAARRRLFQTSCAAALWFDGLFGEQRHVASAQNTSGR
ncbi:MAG: SMP-30/gluconolactonase/LRE family protein, partial [Myxococcota bacterium]